MNKTFIFLTSVLVHLAAADTIIADFNDLTSGPLGQFEPGIGQEGGEGFLSGDTWSNTGTLSVIANDLTPPPFTNYAVSQTPTGQSVQGNNTAGRQSTRALAVPLRNTVWFSFLLNQPTIDSRGGITFNQNTSAPSNPRIVATGTELRLGLGPTLQAVGEGANLLTLGETALILGRLTIDAGGGSDTLDLWINPDVGGDSSSLPAPDTTLTEETPSLDPGIIRLGIQSYSSDSQGGIVDSVRVSDALNAFEVVTRDSAAIDDDPNLVVDTTNPFNGVILATNAPPLIIELPVENSGLSNQLTFFETTGFTGPDADSYSLLTSLPLTLAPGTSGLLRIEVTPSGGPRLSESTLNLASNDSSAPVITIPLSVRMTGPDGNQLLNGDFETDPALPVNWLSTGNTTLAEGIAPGSLTSASLAPSENLRQEVFGQADWVLQCFFQSPETFERAFNLMIDGGFGNINLRFQGTANGAEQTWNLFDNITINDSWGEALALPAVQPGATYFLRVIGNGWDGVNPSYDIELSSPNSIAIAGSVSGLSRFQNSVPSGAPSLIRFSTEFGNSSGFVLDDVSFANGLPAPPIVPRILSIAHDPVSDTTTLLLATEIGMNYAVEASPDLSTWTTIADFTAIESSQTVSERGVTASQRFYRLSVVE